jgi:hypothetical protein
MNTIIQANDMQREAPEYSLLSDWLIDSGASSHMTPHLNDLILNVTDSNAVVQVANGVLIQANQCGTVRIRIQDINNDNITCPLGTRTLTTTVINR